MTDYELLDMIGEVNEDYVLAADSNVVRPRFRWKALAACAACAVLALGAYPVYQAVNPPLHDYTLMENSADSVDTVKEWDDLAKAPAGGALTGPNTGWGTPRPRRRRCGMTHCSRLCGWRKIRNGTAGRGSRATGCWP